MEVVLLNDLAFVTFNVCHKSSRVGELHIAAGTFKTLLLSMGLGSPVDTNGAFWGLVTYDANVSITSSFTLELHTTCRADDMLWTLYLVDEILNVIFTIVVAAFAVEIVYIVIWVFFHFGLVLLHGFD